MERHAFLEKSEYPGWIKALMEKDDRKWTNKVEEWRFSKYLKCRICKLLRVFNQVG